MRKILILAALFATTGLFAASLSVTIALPEDLVIQVNGWSYYSRTNNVTVTNLFDGYNRITVLSNESIIFDQKVLLKDDYLTEITFNRSNKATVDQRKQLEGDVVANWNIWDY